MNKKSEELQSMNMSWGQCMEAFEEANKEENIIRIEDDTKWMEDKIVAVQAVQKETRTEMMLRATVETSSGIKMLEDPEMFVCDTGAATHSTGHGIGLIDLKDGGGHTKSWKWCKCNNQNSGSSSIQDKGRNHWEHEWDPLHQRSPIQSHKRNEITQPWM